MAADAAPPVKVLTDLPSDALDYLLEHCSYEAICNLHCASKAFDQSIRATINSAAWRQRAHNFEHLCLGKLRGAAYSTGNLNGVCGGMRALYIEGDLLASASKDSFARLWDLTTIDAPCICEWLQTEWVGAAAISPGGTLLATGCDDGHVRVYPTKSTAAENVVQLHGESSSWITGVGFACAHHTTETTDESELTLVSISRDGELCTWDVPGRTLLAREYDRPVSLPGARSSNLVAALDVLGTTAVFPRSVSTSTADAAGQALLVYEVGGARALCRTMSLELEGRPMSSVALDRGGRGAFSAPDCVASGGGHGLVQIWDLRSGKVTHRLENACGGSIRAVALSGHMLVAGRDPGPLVNVWDLRGPRIVQRLRGHTNNDALALDAVRGRIACGGRMNELRVWQLDV